MNLAHYIKEVRKNGKRYFTIEHLMSDLNLSKNAALNAIYRIKEFGELISPARGLYVIVPPECMSYGSIPAEDLVIILMRYLQADYYVALLSAASFYGAAHQKSNAFQIITNKRIKHPLEFGQIKIDVVYKKSLDDLPIQDFTMSAGYLKVATPELVAIDLLNYLNRSAGLNHVATVLSELIEAMDEDKLITIASMTKEISHLQRLGYILEKIDTMDEDKKNRIITKLETYLSKRLKVYIPLASEIPKTGYPRCKKWKIIENTNIESDL
jgi:predicted transcriptional regulator of viral defense system